MNELSETDGRVIPETGHSHLRRRWLTRRRLLFIGVTTLMVAGMALNWGWLTAIGLAPLLVSLAPCALMCGLGLCMKGGSGGTCNDPGGAMPDQTER
jgi:hypothetical protein